jgi:hypothetical protein
VGGLFEEEGIPGGKLPTAGEKEKGKCVCAYRYKLMKKNKQKPLRLVQFRTSVVH